MKYSIVANDLACNNTSYEAWKSLLCIMTPKSLYNQDVVNSKHLFANLTNSTDEQLWFVDSGRTALTLLLRSLGLDTQDEVLIQAFSCIVVPNSVLQAELRPVVCDIESDYNISLKDSKKRITKHTKVLIIQHTMGSLCDMQSILTFCAEHNLILIEDCAHALGATYRYKGKTYPVGSLGEGAIYSFGRDKVISTTVGGVIRLNTSIHKKNLQALYQALPEMSYIKEFRSLMYIVMCTFLVKPLYYVFNVGKGVLWLAQKINLVQEVYTITEKKITDKLISPSKYGTRLARILRLQLEDFESTRIHRKQIYDIYSEHLKASIQSANYFRFCINVDSKKEYLAVLTSLRHSGRVLAGKWYTNVFLPSISNNYDLLHYNPETTPNAKKFSNHKVINLPTNRSVTRARAEHIASLVTNAIGNRV